MASVKKEGKRQSRVSEAKKKGAGQTYRGKKGKALNQDDFDPNNGVGYNARGQQVDPSEAREVRLPIVIKGMREGKSVRAIAEELGVHPSTTTSDKRYILEEAWELRQTMIPLWLEEQLQAFEELLRMVMAQGSRHLIPEVKKNKKGEMVIIGHTEVLDLEAIGKAVSILDKMSELKGLRSNTYILERLKGDVSELESRDSESAAQLLDFLKSASLGGSKTLPS